MGARFRARARFFLSKERARSGKAPAPGDDVEPGTQGAAAAICDLYNGNGRLEDGESCPNCNGTGVVIKAVGGGG